MAAETHGSSVVRPCAASRFNGAAAGWRRKRHLLLSKEVCSAPASMGPPLVGGGNALNRLARVVEESLLQWGRRWLAAETDEAVLGRVARRDRFNGAAAGWRRKPMARTAPHVSVVELQWGRRWLAAETFFLLRAPDETAELQWGRRWLAAETIAVY